jgi:DNA-binding NarL/FixJ family response regulator
MLATAGVEALDELTGAELRVLELMAGGMSNAAIATALTVSPRTVESQVHSVLWKLSLLPGDTWNRRVAAVLIYLQAAGMIE